MCRGGVVERVNDFRRIFLSAASAFCVASSSLFAAPEITAGQNVPAFVGRSEGDSNSEFITTVWKTGEGLPVNEINELEVTPDGYLWMGTHQGLIRFDGVRFETFFNIPTGTRFGSRVGPLELDSRGQLWVVPDQIGILRRNSTGFTEFLTNSPHMKSRVLSLCSDGTNQMLWVDSTGNLGRFSLDRPNEVEGIQGPDATTTTRWVRDFNGKLWLTDQRSLDLFENGKWREIPMIGNATLVATPRRAGGMWIARDAKLRIVSDNGDNVEVATFPWKGQSRVTYLLEDSKQRLWIGTLGQGLYCWANGDFKQVFYTSSSIQSILEDNQDNIWAATRGNGLVRVRQRQFFIHDFTTGLRNEFVRSLAQDKYGRIWMTTVDGGLGWWKNGNWHNLSRAEGWRNFDAPCVLPLRDGGVWISTIHRGLWRWGDGKLTQFDLGTNAPPEPFMDLLEDHKRRLWLVTDNTGIFCIEGGKITTYSTEHGLPSMHIRAIVEDAAGDIWAGDWEGGIARFHENRWEMMREPSGHADAVRCMIVSNDALWIGTSNGGLLRFKNRQTRRVSINEGLPDASVQQLLLDGRGSLWGGTPHRLFRLSLAQLNEVADGRRARLEAITYGRSDGLPDVSFASWCDPRCWRTTDGELWFATANGAMHFYPENLRESKPPQVAIEQTLIDGKPVENVESLQMLRPGAGRVEFRFTAPCLTAPERVRFRYQLTGVDGDWVDAGKARSVTYAGLPSGRHTFRVLASTPEGVWGSQDASIALAVNPYYWQTNWFIASIAAVMAGGGVWAVRRTTVRRLSRRLQRVREEHAIERERARIAQDIHDELGANLTTIGLLADMGSRHKQDPAAVTRELNQISQTARESVAAMDAIVWALNPRNDSLDHFANYVAQFTRDFFRPTDLRTRLEIPVDLPAQPLPMETRHQLFLIVKESFNNIIRHAKASEVHVELGSNNGVLRLVIADDGKGLSRDAVGEGHDGLANLRERIERLDGKLTIGSHAGKGTKLEFVVPLTSTKTKDYAP